MARNGSHVFFGYRRRCGDNSRCLSGRSSVRPEFTLGTYRSSRLVSRRSRPGFWRGGVRRMVGIAHRPLELLCSHAALSRLASWSFALAPAFAADSDFIAGGEAFCSAKPATQFIGFEACGQRAMKTILAPLDPASELDAAATLDHSRSTRPSVPGLPLRRWRRSSTSTQRQKEMPPRIYASAVLGDFA